MSTKPYSGLRIKTDPINLVRAATFMGARDVRFYLNGIHFEKAAQGGLYIVATNGHVLAAIYDAEGIFEHPDDCATLAVSKEMLAACRVATTKKQHPLKPKFIAHDARLSIAPDFDLEHSDHEAFVQGGNPWIDCSSHKYPDWRRVLPDFSKIERGGLTSDLAVNPEYLAKFAKLAAPGSAMALWHGGGADALVVQLVAVPNFIGILMPMRGESKNFRSDSARVFPKAVAPAPVIVPAQEAVAV